MKRIWFFIISGLLLFCSAGGRSAVTSLDRAMVHAVGIDRTEDGFRVTLQVFRPDGTGTDTQLNTAKPNIFIITAEADSVGEAMAECGARLGEELFIGHNRLILFGEGVGLERSGSLLSEFVRSKESYLGAETAFTENASELLSAELSEGAVAAQSIVDIITRHADDSRTVPCDLLEVTDAERETVVMPRLELIRSGSGDNSEMTVSAAGAEVYVDGVRRLRLSRSECMGLGCLTGTAQRAVLSSENSDASVLLTDIVSNTELSEDGSRLNVRYTVSAAVTDDQSTEQTGRGGQLRQEAQLRLTELCGQIPELCREYSADLLGLEGLVRAHCPEVWQDCGGSFPRLLDRCSVSVEVSVGDRVC